MRLTKEFTKHVLDVLALRSIGRMSPASVKQRLIDIPRPVRAVQNWRIPMTMVEPHVVNMCAG